MSGLRGIRTRHKVIRLRGQVLESYCRPAATACCATEHLPLDSSSAGSGGVTDPGHPASWGLPYQCGAVTIPGTMHLTISDLVPRVGCNSFLGPGYTTWDGTVRPLDSCDATVNGLLGYNSVLNCWPSGSYSFIHVGNGQYILSAMTPILNGTAYSRSFILSDYPPSAPQSGPPTNLSYQSTAFPQANDIFFCYVPSGIPVGYPPPFPQYGYTNVCNIVPSLQNPTGAYQILAEKIGGGFNPPQNADVVDPQRNCVGFMVLCSAMCRALIDHNEDCDNGLPVGITPPFYRSFSRTQQIRHEIYRDASMTFSAGGGTCNAGFGLGSIVCKRTTFRSDTVSSTFPQDYFSHLQLVDAPTVLVVADCIQLPVSPNVTLDPITLSGFTYSPGFTTKFTISA